MNNNYTHGVEAMPGYFVAVAMFVGYLLYGLAIILGVPLNVLVLYRMIRLSTKLTGFYK